MALVTGVLAVFFTLFPWLKPFAPSTQRATARVVAVERRVTRDEWRWRVSAGDRRRHRVLARADGRSSGFKEDPCNIGGLAGYVIDVKTDASGFRRRSLVLRGQLYNARTDERVPRFQDYASLAQVPVEAPAAASVSEVWLWDPGPSRHRRYFARIELYDPHGNILDVADSPSFPAISPQEQDVNQGCGRGPRLSALATRGQRWQAFALVALCLAAGVLLAASIRRLRGRSNQVPDVR